MNTNKILVIIIIILFNASSVGGFLSVAENISNNTDEIIPKIKECKLSISEPIFTNLGDYININIEEQTSYLMDEGKPMLPIITNVFTFPAGTIIDNTEIKIDWDEINLSEKIIPSPTPEPLTLEPVIFGQENKKIDVSVYSSDALYPSEPYTIRMGSGLKDGEHVLFYNIRCNVQYSPAKNLLKVPKIIDIDIEYSEPSVTLFNTNIYDLLIITHSKFKEKLQRLVDYKNSIGINTTMVTVDEIYPNYNGIADWEDIKLFLADAVEDWGVDYVLLAGGRKGQTNEWYVPEFLSNNFDGAYSGSGVAYDMTYASDLYYADIYYQDRYGLIHMDDWDTNDNGIYAEGPYSSTTDYPDYYPDVYLGRIPFRYSWEVDIVVDKIIEYDSNVNPSWFYKAILVGGDTSPPARGDATLGIYEGELACEESAKHLSSIGFSTIKCYTSTNGDLVVTGPDDISSIISQGCGWVQMDTHSNPALCGNFQPDAPTEAEFSQFYTIFDARNLNNDGMYPFLVIDGCHSGQFNVTMQQAIDAGGINYPRAGFLEYSPTDQCSWALLQEGGGSIGTIGVTALGYGYSNEFATYGLGGWITPRWAYVYAKSGIEYTGEILAQGITDYINIIGYVDSDEIDRKTIEERVLLGDPSLRIGGNIGSLSGQDNDADNDEETLVSFSGIEAPIWEVGDTWTYDIDNINIGIHEVENRDIDLKLNTEDFKLTVVEIQSDAYVTEFSSTNANIEADIYFDYYNGEHETPLNISIALKNLDLQGEIIFTKDSLAIKSVDLHIILDIIENLEGLPIGIDLSTLPPIAQKILSKIKIPADISLTIDFDPALTYLDFPLETAKTWGIPTTDISIDIDGEITSIWLRVAKFFNNFLHFIPEDFAKYLPVIDIGDILEDLGIPSLIQKEIPGMDVFFRKPLFEASTEKTITVPAGSYNSYEVEVIQGLGEIYYSQQTKNFIKLYTPINEFCPIIQSISMVLKSTNQ